MGTIFKNGIEYANTFLGTLRGKFKSMMSSTTGWTGDVDDTPSSTQYYTGFEIVDVNDIRTSNLDTHVYSEGTIATVLGAHRVVNGEDIYNQIYLKIADDGTRSYQVDEPAKFRNAIGFPSNPSYSTISTSDFITFNSGWSSSTAKVVSYGNIKFLSWIAKYSSAWSQGTQLTMGTLKAGYRPIIETTFNSINGVGIIATNGTVYIKATAAITANTEIWYHAVIIC